MKVLFLVPYPEGEAPSQRFRFEQYLGDLELEGFEVVTQSFLTEAGWNALYKKGMFGQKFVALISGCCRRFSLIFGVVQRAHMVFIHREAAPLGPPVLEWLIAAVFRKRIIYDFDDSIWLPNTSEENKIVSKLKWHSKVASICRWSHRVSVGNEYLQEYAKKFNANVVVNPTTIDADHVHVPGLNRSATTSTVVVLGWTGTHSTLKYLKEIEPVLFRLEELFGSKIRFVVIANQRPNLNLGNIEFVKWSKSKEIEDLLQLDIGLMPLVDDAWTRGKCGLKILQYMALGIPAVASPVGLNKKLIDNDKNGYLCETPEEWFERLRQLIDSATLRRRLGDAGRDARRHLHLERR